MRRLSAVVVAGAFAVLGLAGCAGTGAAGTPAALAAEVGAESQALQAIGYDAREVAVAGAEPVATASPGAAADPTAKPGRGDRDRKRGLLRRNTLHGEVVVRTKDGNRTVVVQRGTVTAITDTSVTVKSTDGFTLTWTYGDKLRVVEHRATVQPKDVAVGAAVGIAGAKDGDKAVARLIVIPKK
jgi:hypothetical protein